MTDPPHKKNAVGKWNRNGLPRFWFFALDTRLSHLSTAAKSEPKYIRRSYTKKEFFLSEAKILNMLKLGALGGLPCKGGKF
jgi:hypothetical protein